MLPANQRLQTGHFAGAQIVDRLVEQEELLLRQRGVQLGLEHRTTLDDGAHVGVEERVAVFARGLCRGQGQVRVAQQVIGSRVAAKGDADTRGQDEAWPKIIELDGLVQGLDHALGQGVEPHPAGCRFDQHHELVSSETTHGVVRSYHALQPFPDDSQQLITGGLPELFVDILESVDVDEQSARQHPRIASRSRDHALGTVQREHAVGKTGQGVVEL